MEIIIEKILFYAGPGTVVSWIQAKEEHKLTLGRWRSARDAHPLAWNSAGMIQFSGLSQVNICFLAYAKAYLCNGPNNLFDLHVCVGPLQPLLCRRNFVVQQRSIRETWIVWYVFYQSDWKTASCITWGTTTRLSVRRMIYQDDDLCYPTSRWWQIYLNIVTVRRKDRTPSKQIPDSCGVNRQWPWMLEHAKHAPSSWS